MTSSAIEELVTFMSVPSHRFRDFRRAYPGCDEIWENGRAGGIFNLPGVGDVTPRDLIIQEMCAIWSRRSIEDFKAAEPGRWANFRKSIEPEDGSGLDADWKHGIRRVKILGQAANKSQKLPPSVTLIRVEDIWVNGDGRVVEQQADVVGWSRANGYFLIRRNGVPVNRFPAGAWSDWRKTREKHIRAELVCGFGLQYEWVAAVGYSGCGSVILPTNPELLVDLFRTRDIPAGKRRRDAMLNWVGAHVRRKRSDPDALVEVRRHLRGSHRFNWDGFEVVVKPSADEMKSLTDNPSRKIRELLIA